jgi:hypothetical protein
MTASQLTCVSLYPFPWIWILYYAMVLGVRAGWTGRVGSSTSFFQIFLPASVLDPSVLTGHESDGFKHGSGRGGSRGRIPRVGFFPDGFF